MHALQEEFLEEMRLEYSRRSQASESLTKKANNLMTVSGIIATLIMGLYGSLYDVDEFTILEPSSLILVSMVMMILAVFYCVLVNKVEFQRTIFLGKNLRENSMTSSKIIKSWTNSRRDNYHEALIDEYVKCLYQAECAIEEKSTKLSNAIRIFLSGLIGFPALFVLGMAF